MDVVPIKYWLLAVLYVLLLSCSVKEQSHLEQEELRPWLFIPISRVTIFKQLSPEQCEERRQKDLKENCINSAEYKELQKRSSIAICMEGIPNAWLKCPFEE